MQNLLSAIGAAPHVSRPKFPQPASHYPAGVNLTLLPFGESALRHFMFLERPEGMALLTGGEHSIGYATSSVAAAQLPGDVRKVLVGRLPPGLPLVLGLRNRQDG